VLLIKKNQIMKKLLLFVLFMATNLLWAQSAGFNYKALITDNGNALTNQSVNIKFTLLDNATTAVYDETHIATTDTNGIVSVNIGEGTVGTGDFSTIDWGANSFFLKVEIDTQDGNGYQDFGTNEFKSVPYAKYAEKAGNTFSGNYADLQGAPDTSAWDTDATDDITEINDLSDARYIDHSLYLGIDAGLNDNGTDNRNTGVGYRVLDSIISGGSNVAMGFEAQFSNKNGYDNTAIGDRALYRNNNNGNTAVGFNTLYHNTSGSRNVALGRNAGKNNMGSKNIFIGYHSGMNETGDDKLYIDNTDTSTPLIYGDFNQNYVTINGELHGADSGNADMKAYIYGTISPTGNISSTGASSDGFTVVRAGTGVYNVTFNQSPGSANNYIVVASMNYGFLGFISVVNYNTYFEVRTYNTSAAVSNESFNFVVYKK
jgi:hypothetical protein